MQKSEQINDLAKALAVAQGQILGAKKDSVNPFFKSNYADLSSVWEAIRKPLSENGLSVAQVTRPPTAEEDNCMVLETILMHTSGQWISGAIPVVAKDQTAQAMGSAITYSRRYALTAMVGVYQEDDDANLASKPKASKHISDADAEPPPYDEWGPLAGEKEKLMNHAPKTNGPSEAQIKRLWAMSKNLKWSYEDVLTAIKQQHGKDKPELLTREEYTLFTSKLQVEIDKNKMGG